jgi:hypothetical protein
MATDLVSSASTETWQGIDQAGDFCIMSAGKFKEIAGEQGAYLFLRSHFFYAMLRTYLKCLRLDSLRQQPINRAEIYV